MQLKLGDFLKTIRSLPNEIKMCRICTTNVSCGSGQMVCGATGGEFETTIDSVLLRLTLLRAVSQSQHTPAGHKEFQHRAGCLLHTNNNRVDDARRCRWTQ